ncbi:MAG: OmpA family protein, partial [Cyanothece sp. SIO1E1]|nr:OmpA family protein [Cyanothece sp. SIO1E1]
IQDLAQQLSPTAASPTAPTAAAPVTSPSTPTTAISSATTGQTIVASGPLFQANTLMVTLPSDILFKPQQNQLRPETQVILDSIVNDLRNYPESTIRIAAHTDNKNDFVGSRSQSFQQAEAVQNYLTDALGNTYNWFVVGYGQTRPLSDNDTETNRQRNRRIEIAIDPK